MDVVIVAYNSRSVIERSIRAALLIRTVEVVVVVDNGPDGSGARAAELGAQVVLLPENPGFGGGQNEGVRHSCAPLVLLLNPDAEPDSDGVAAGVAYMDARSDVAAVQGVIVNRMTGMPERSQGRELGPVHLIGRALHFRTLAGVVPLRWLAGRSGMLRDYVQRIPQQPLEVESLAATALLIRRAAFEGVGGFDERFFLYGEDLDLCRRLRAAGWKLVALPDRWALHTSGESSGSLFEREWHWWRGTLQFAAYWWQRPAWSLALLAATLQALKSTVTRAAGSWRIWHGIVGWALEQRKAHLP